MNTNDAIQVDSHYQTGRGHSVCQDYALHGLRPRPFVVLSDGCSSVPDTDVGARLLAWAARDYLAAPVAWRHGAAPRAGVLARQAAQQAAAAARVLGLDSACLDATLAVAVVDQRHVHVYVLGDGCVIVRDHAGGVRSFCVSYSHNMPYYPSYRLQPARKARYAEQSRTAFKRVVRSWTPAIELQDCRQATHLRFAVTRLAALAITSDGLDSLPGNGIAASWDVAAELVRFRSVQGAFVTRRVRRLGRQWHRAGRPHDDDLAVGGIAFGALDNSAEHGHGSL